MKNNAKLLISALIALGAYQLGLAITPSEYASVIENKKEVEALLKDPKVKDVGKIKNLIDQIEKYDKNLAQKLNAQATKAFASPKSTKVATTEEAVVGEGSEERLFGNNPTDKDPFVFEEESGDESGVEKIETMDQLKKQLREDIDLARRTFTSGDSQYNSYFKQIKSYIKLTLDDDLGDVSDELKKSADFNNFNSKLTSIFKSYVTEKNKINQIKVLVEYVEESSDDEPEEIVTLDTIKKRLVEYIKTFDDSDFDEKKDSLAEGTINSLVGMLSDYVKDKKENEFKTFESKFYNIIYPDSTMSLDQQLEELKKLVDYERLVGE